MDTQERNRYRSLVAYYNPRLLNEFDGLSDDLLRFLKAQIEVSYAGGCLLHDVQNDLEQHGVSNDLSFHLVASSIRLRVIPPVDPR